MALYIFIYSSISSIVVVLEETSVFVLENVLNVIWVIYGLEIKKMTVLENMDLILGTLETSYELVELLFPDKTKYEIIRLLKDALDNL